MRRGVVLGFLVLALAAACGADEVVTDARAIDAAAGDGPADAPPIDAAADAPPIDAATDAAIDAPPIPSCVQGPQGPPPPPPQPPPPPPPACPAGTTRCTVGALVCVCGTPGGLAICGQP